MASAIAFTCAELIGPGSVATAASMASFMMPIVSGGKLAFEKSFIRPVLIPVVNELTRPTTLSSLQTHMGQSIQLLRNRGCSFRICRNNRQVGCELLVRSGLVFRRNRYDWVPTCRIASCKSTRVIAGQYLVKLQRDCASFWQRNNRKARVLLRAKSTAYANWMKTRPRLFRHSARRASGSVPDRWSVDPSTNSEVLQSLRSRRPMTEFSSRQRQGVGGVGNTKRSTV